jgi:hypothetical protein
MKEEGGLKIDTGNNLLSKVNNYTFSYDTRCGACLHESPFPTVWRNSTSNAVGSSCNQRLHFHLTICEVGYSFPLYNMA